MKEYRTGAWALTVSVVGGFNIGEIHMDICAQSGFGI